MNSTAADTLTIRLRSASSRSSAGRSAARSGGPARPVPSSPMPSGTSSGARSPKAASIATTSARPGAPAAAGAHSPAAGSGPVASGSAARRTRRRSSPASSSASSSLNITPKRSSTRMASSASASDSQVGARRARASCRRRRPRRCSSSRSATSMTNCSDLVSGHRGAFPSVVAVRVAVGVVPRPAGAQDGLVADELAGGGARQLRRRRAAARGRLYGGEPLGEHRSFRRPGGGAGSASTTYASMRTVEDDDGGGDLGQRGEGVLDLGQVDLQAADGDLRVEPAQHADQAGVGRRRCRRPWCAASRRPSGSGSPSPTYGECSAARPAARRPDSRTVMPGAGVSAGGARPNRSVAMTPDLGHPVHVAQPDAVAVDEALVHRRPDQLAAGRHAGELRQRGAPGRPRRAVRCGTGRRAAWSARRSGGDRRQDAVGGHPLRQRPARTPACRP